MRPTRRDFLRYSAAGLVAVPIAGTVRWLSPAEALAASAPFSTLTADEAALLGDAAEVLVPSAKAAGVAHYIDHHLTVPAADSLLGLRYLDWPPPYTKFYHAGLKALARFAAARHAKPFSALDTAQREALMRAVMGGSAEGWQGPPAGLFGFVLRLDAIDVVYGTEKGFAALGVPYLAHIAPPTPW